MNIVVAVTGSIAAYKAIDLVSRLKKEDHDIRVVMTQNATHFVAPLTFETISHNKCIVGMFDEDVPALAHIELSKWADLCVIVPADANVIAKLAHGIADDFLTTFILAFEGSVILAPAMNTVMYHQQITQNNIKELTDLGYEFILPTSGKLACGDVGDGKLADISSILYAVKKFETRQSLKKLKIVVTAGPTIGKIDPVRYITNYSSGKMGFSLANAAALRGADVTLVAGKVQLDTPEGVSRVNVTTTDEMLEVLKKLMLHSDVLIMAAAPADYAPIEFHDEKIKKSDTQLILTLKKNDDILKSLQSILKGKITVGFAAESHSLIMNAKKKLVEKNLDMIVANNISGKDTAFQSDYNTVTFLHRDGRCEDIPKLLKTQVANRILDEIEKLVAR